MLSHKMMENTSSEILNHVIIEGEFIIEHLYLT
jgi:hypothetical protein